MEHEDFNPIGNRQFSDRSTDLCSASCMSVTLARTWIVVVVVVVVVYKSICIAHHAVPLMRYSSVLRCEEMSLQSRSEAVGTPTLRAAVPGESGSEFHSIGPATEKARRPNVLRRCRGTISRSKALTA